MNLLTMIPYFQNLTVCGYAAVIAWFGSANLPAIASDASTNLFNGPARTFDLQVSEAGMTSLRLDRRRYVEANLTVGTQSWERVAIRIKGSAGSVKPVDDRPALTVDANRHVKGQRIFGLQKLYLNNSAQDLSRLQECFAYECYTRLGIPVARVTHAVVRLNGRDLGVYVLKEGYDQNFLARHFAKASGNLYDPPLGKDIPDDLELDLGEEPPDYADLKLLRAAVAETNLAARLARLERCLEVDRFITMTAVQALTADWDSYAYKPNNYRVYFPPDTGRAVFIPCGMDQLFQRMDWPLDAPFQGSVARALFAIPSERSRLVEEMARLHREVFTESTIHRNFERHHQRLRELLATRPGEESRKINEYAGMLLQNILTRSKTTANLLRAPASPSVMKRDIPASTGNVSKLQAANTNNSHGTQK